MLLYVFLYIWKGGSSMIETNHAKKYGGSFIVEDHLQDLSILIPENFTEDQQMIAKTTEEFVAREITALGEATKTVNYELTRKIVKKAGDVGLLGACLPEEYGGLGLDGIRFAILKESLNSGASSLTTTVGGQMGIGMLPIIFFGTPEQREKYLPQLQAGDIITSFALTEPASGTDASGIKTSAKLSEDGKHYILNGSKVFITNAGFADIFVVFAKVDGTEFSTFIVERTLDGVSVGPEEKKMGLKASSTCSVTFDEVKVPVENLLGQIGKGHLFAFNTLNFGRLSVGAGCLGNSKHAIDCSVKYANERVQFGKSISKFPLIAKKIADMNIKTFVLESMVYRTAGMFNEGIVGLDFSDPEIGVKSRKPIAEYMIECAINKVFGSETLDFVADEGVQIHGGYGYMQEYEIEEIYRDARIKRIFEGTNEINRLFITKTLSKRLVKGSFPELQAALEQIKQIDVSKAVEQADSLGENLLKLAKNIFLYTFAQSFEKYGADLEDEQEIASDLADILIQMYAMESALLRTKKLIEEKGEDGAEMAIQMTTVFTNEAFEEIVSFANKVLPSVSENENLRKHVKTIAVLSEKAPINTNLLKRSISAKVIEREKYTI